MARNPGRWTVLERGLWLSVALFAMAADVRGQAVVKPRLVPVPLLRALQARGEPTAAAAEEELAENVFLPADRHTLQKLADSRRLLAENRFGEAVRCLGDILDGPEDFFFQPDKNSPIHRSLKAEAQRLIGQLPREGRELYELQYGAQARRMLAEALQSGDLVALAEVSRRFFHTRSGYQATFLLGMDHFDHGRPLAGAVTLQRLREVGPYAEEMEPTLSLTTAACWLQAGAMQKARETLVSLRQRHPSIRVAVAGREVPIFTDDSDAVDWLVKLVGAVTAASPAEADRWLMFRGDAMRNAASVGGVPLLNVRWRVAATDDPQMATGLEQYERQCAEQGVPTIPALHPLAVADVLLMRTARNLLAVDFATGKRLWEAPVEEGAETMTGVPPAETQMMQSMMLQELGQRMWCDTTYGTLSSDGRCVFAVEDLELGMGPAGGMMPGGMAIRFGQGRVNARGGPAAPGEQTSISNRLAAYDIRTGKIKWNIGGPDGQTALRQPDTFFLGPPLPLTGQLYALGEIKGEIRLMALDAATGNLLWSQQLAMVEQGVLQDSMRRWSGMSPSYADGVLVCPTSAGAIVGVDLATRSLLWGYRYGQGRHGNQPNMGIVAMPMASGGPAQSRWLDGTVAIVDGRVLATPVESDWLYCLSLIDGKELWKSARQDDLYVACSDRDKVVLVGRRAVRAMRLADGKPAWNGRTVALPSGATPSGRGFLAADRYFLPLSNSEVASVDLAAGKIVETAISRKGIVPGNLVCYRGKVVSQGLEGVDAYWQLDSVKAEAERRLAANPNDAEALSLRGEILLDAGKRSEAVAAFRRAYGLAGDARTRELLRDSLLDGLRTEFAVYRDQGGELEGLVDNAAGRAVYLRLMTDGLRREGQWAPAFDCLQKLIDLEPNSRPLDQISKTLTVRRDRWFQGQLSALRGEAAPDPAAKIDAAVDVRLKAAMAAGSLDDLQRFLDYFGDQPAAAGVRTEVVKRLNGLGRPLDAELAVRGEIAGDIAARKRQKEQDASWPVGKVEVAPVAAKPAQGNGYGRRAVDIRGSGAPFLSDLSVHFDDNSQLLVANDGLGRERWHVSLAAEGQRQNLTFSNPAWSYARVQGHLLVIAAGMKIIAIDTLGAGSNKLPRLLWTQDLMGIGFDPISLRPLPGVLVNLPWQWQRQFGQTIDRSNLLGPITNQYVCFQRLRGLVAVDPHDGQTLWVRQDVPAGSDLFGDDQYLFVLPPDKAEAMLLRATDGELLGTRRVPRVAMQEALPNGEQKMVFSRLDQYCLATLGRRLLLWWPEENQRKLILVDPLEGRDAWPERKFSGAAHACVVDNEAAAVLEPDGRFVLIGLPDGRTIAETKLDAAPTLMDISLLADGGRYFLFTQTASSNPLAISAMPGTAARPINRGRVYAFDEQGKLLWPAPAMIENQCLLLDQPARLPILTFACNLYEQKRNGQGQQKMRLLAVDKRNGRTVCKREFVNRTGALDITGDVEKRTVDLAMQREAIRLTFTDKPMPPPSPTDGEPAKLPRDGNAAGALWDSLQKTLGRMLDGLGEEGDE
jgi:outer membrane protein assembly factor BamB